MVVETRTTATLVCEPFLFPPAIFGTSFRFAETKKENFKGVTVLS